MEPSTVLNILIAGDSWGCGEWDTIQEFSIPEWTKKYQQLRGDSWPAQSPTTEQEFNQLSTTVRKELIRFGFPKWNFVHQNHIKQVIRHPGLAQYLTEYGHRVINVSRGSESNNYAIEKIRAQDLSQFDLIIWFQTDPFRDLRPYNRKFSVDYTTYQSLIDRQNQLLTKTYMEMDSFDKKILCLGGLSKLDLKLIQPFKNLIPAIPSITELLLPNFQHQEIAFSDWHKLIDRQFSLDDLDKLLYNKRIQDSLMDHKELFWPDGLHPNRWAHKKIFEYLINKWL